VWSRRLAGSRDALCARSSDRDKKQKNNYEVATVRRKQKQNAPSSTIHGRPARTRRMRRMRRWFLFRAAHGPVHPRGAGARVLRHTPLRRRVRRLVAASSGARARVLVCSVVPLHSRSRRARAVHASRPEMRFKRLQRFKQPRRFKRARPTKRLAKKTWAHFGLFFQRKHFF